VLGKVARHRREVAVLRLLRFLPAQRVEQRLATRTIRADDLFNCIFSTFCIGK
jgi:tRNA U34 5-carboxymethylaminomethyl modifying GTPase MnmE/TrmE